MPRSWATFSAVCPMAMYTSGTSPSSRGSCQSGAPSADRATVRCCAPAKTGFCVSGQLSLLPWPNLLTHSTPADRNTSPSPALMAWNAILVVWGEEEQYGDRGARQVVVAQHDGR